MHTPLRLPRSGRGLTSRWASRLLALALPALALTSQAQSITNYTFAPSSGTFTALTGATVAPVPTTDDDVTGVLPIGFTFVYNGVPYTTFGASTNGNLTLGGVASAAAGNNLTTNTPRPIIAPLWDDHLLSTTSGISYQTTGTAGSRVLTVEWINVYWRYTASAAGISFQAKMYEADGHIDFVYRQEAGALATPTASIGITAVATGSGNFLSLSDATAAPTVSSTTENTAIATKPATGQVYTFTPAGGAVTAPGTPAFSAITSSGSTVTFADNSTNEYGFMVTITPTAGGTPVTTIVPSTTTAGTGTSYTANFTALTGATSYTVQVSAVGQGRLSSASSGTFTSLAGATLNGTYYVGTGTSPQPTRTYATLTAAIDAYNTGTLAGPVTFLLLDNAYSTAETFPIVIRVNTGASATNTLTIRPNTGVTNATITATTSAAAAIQFNGADYVTLDGSNTAGGTTRNLSIIAPSTTGAAVIQLLSLGTGAGATNNTIRNLNLTGASSTAGVGIVAGGSTLGSDGADNDNLTIQNNNITSAYGGMYLLGTAATSAGGSDGMVVTGNTIGGTTNATGIGNIALLLTNAVSPSVTLNTAQNVNGSGSVYGFNFSTGVTGATVSQNTIQNVVSSGANAYGISLGAGFTGGSVTRNQILNISATSTSGYGGKGIDVQTGSATSNLLIANNFVQISGSSGWSSLASDANVGIRLGTGSTLGGVNVYYNSVNLTGTEFYNTATVSAALYVGSSTTAVDIRNNILRNSIVNTGNSGAKAYAFNSAAASTAFTDINYNDYFVSGTQGVLGYIGSDRATLAALQAGTTKDANSLNVDPLFASTTDLHVIAAALNNVATPIAAVTVDIDGTTRSTTTPDIGADEFTPSTTDIAATGLVAPVTTGAQGTCFGTAEAVTVSIRNAGATTLNFATTPATITVVVTGPGGTQNLSFTLNTGTLAAGASQNVTLSGASSTVNLSATGTYTFAITANITGDGNTANNTFTPSPTITVAGSVAATLTPANSNICGSGTATISISGAANGTSQLQSATSATGPFTNVTGAPSSGSYVTPVLTQNTFYRVQTTCGTTTVNSNVAAVTINNAQLAGTPAPVAVCSGQTATLTATSAAGTNVRFFSTATGGTALTGATTSGTTTVTTSQVTPAITANTTYYAEAFIPQGGTESVGLPAPGATATASSSIPSGFQFSTTSPTTFYTAVVYPVGTGTITISILDASGAEVAVTPAIPVSGTGLTTPVRIPINLSLPAAVTNYVLQVKTSTGISGLIRDNPLPTGVTYPFATSAGGFSISTGINVGFPIAAYYFMYDIQVSAPCVASSRTPIQVTLNPAAVATFNYGSSSTLCRSQTTAQSVVLGTGATAGTFSVSPATGLTLNTSTGAITPSTSTAGTYTVTNTVAATGSLCASTATTTVTITNPAVATFNYGTSSTFCQSGTTNPTVSFTGGGTAGTFSVSPATGLTINATTGAITLSSSTAGTYTVTNTIPAANGCAAATATSTVTITAPQSASFNYGTPATFCQSSTTNPTVSLGTGATAGTFTSTTGLTINATTGAITLSSSTPGTYTITNTLPAANGCAAATATSTVTITAPQSATFTYPVAGPNVSYCAGNTAVITASLGTGATAGTFTITGGAGAPTINPTTGALNLSAATAGNYVVTNTVPAANGCAAATAVAAVQVLAAPTAPTVTVVGNNTVTVSNPVAGTTYQIFRNGALVTGTTGSSYNVTSAAGNGNYTVVAVNASGCASPASASVTVNYLSTGSARSLASVRLYPNPTPNGLVSVELKGYSRPATLTVVNTLGQVVRTANATSGTTALDLRELASGVYLLQVRASDEATQTLRFVKE